MKTNHLKKSVFAGLVMLSAVSLAQNTLTPETLWKFGRVSEPVVSPDGKQVLFGITNYNLQDNKGNRDLYTVPVAGGNIVKITNSPKSESNAVWSLDGKKIGFLSSESGSSQLWEINADGTNKVQVSNITDGIDGFQYSNDKQHILFIKSVKMDKTANEIYPDLPKADARIIDGLMYRHWDSWDDYSYSHVFIANYTNGKVSNAKDIMQGERFDSPLQPMGGMEQITNSPSGNEIAYTSKKLNGTAEAISTNADVYIYNVQNGTTYNLTQGMPGYDQEPAYSPDGKKIAWLSMATAGYESDRMRIFVYDFATKIKEEITSGFDQSAGGLNWSADSKIVYFVSATKATEQIFSADIKSHKIKQITNGVADFSTIALAGNQIIGVRTTMSNPAELYRVSLDGKQEQITFVNKDLLSTLKMGKVESRNYKTTDGKSLQTWVIYPPNFDPNKKYPTLLYCQGGPQGAISQSFSYRWNFQLMAANGYIVVAPNRRGVTSFGQEWTDEIAGDWGGQAIKDYLTAIDSVSTLPFVNKDKLGAVGASYGGYSIYYLAGMHNKRFKAFIAHCGLFDMTSWYPSTEEMFFANHDMGGAYWKNPQPKSYNQFSPSSMVGKWDTPILVIHNQRDFRVPVEQGMQAFGAAQLQGIPSKFLYFPEEGHWVNKPQNSVLWNRVFFEWLDKYLK